MTKTKAIFKQSEESQIHLSNPFTDSFEKFIIYNAMNWQTRALVEIEPTLDPRDYQLVEVDLESRRPGMAFAGKSFHDIVGPFAQRNYFVEKGSGKGQHLVLCGAGPSLADHADEYCKQGDQLWGCNSAVTWLAEQGHNPTHGFTVDQTAHMYLEWKDAPVDIEYLVATTIHPSLADFLINEGRRYRYFNNFVGIHKPPVMWPDGDGKNRIMSYEEWLYAIMFPETVQCGSGLNAVTRALDLAAYMDFDKITVLGADCFIRTKGKPRNSMQLGSREHKKWLRKNTVMHADGGHALASEATAMVLQATIDGRFWMTKPDMVISAQWLIRMAKASGGKIRLVGDTLPNFLYDKDEAFWARMPQMTGTDGQPLVIPF